MRPNKPGPKGLPAEVWNDVLERLERGEAKADIVREVGVGLTKVYEIERAGVRKPLPDAGAQ